MTTDPIGELMDQRRWDEASQQLASAGSSLEASRRRFYEGRLLEREKKWEEAAAAYEDVLQESFDEPSAFRLANLADRFGDDDLAVELYERLAEESPAPVNVLVNMAVLYEDLERYDEAVLSLDRVLEEYPNHARALLYEKDALASRNMYYDEERERYREKRNAILETPISDFELSVRARNCLKQMNIHTLGDLLRTTSYELLSYKNFGETSLHEIEHMLTQKGLRLGQLLEEQEEALVPVLGPPGLDPAKASILNRSVAELELSVRSRKCLMRLGINSINELVQRTEAELLGIKNFGATSLTEIKLRLTDFGLALRAD